MENPVEIKSIEVVTHDVRRIRTEKPEDLKFTPGQAVEVSINKDGWKNEKRPFTFTCLPEDDFVEFTIKTYPAREGVTNELLHLKEGDELILHDVFGAINYKGEGIFIAGGAGVTPFIAILRNLNKKNELGENKLLFSNKKKNDIILKKEFEEMLGKNFINILSEEKTDEYPYGHFSEDFLKANVDDFNKYFYVCGPPPMIDAVEKQLTDLSVKKNMIIKEEL